MFKVKVAKSVVKYIKKLGKNQRDYLLKRFDRLKYDKKGYKLLDVLRNIELWELSCQAHRIYYTVENRFIIIDNIEFEGNIIVAKAGNKNT